MRKFSEQIDLPQFTYFYKMAVPAVLDEVVLLLLVHLPDCPAFVQAFEECGIDPQRIFGVSYSASQEIKAKTWEQWDEALRTYQGTDKHLLVVEESGHKVSLLHMDFLDHVIQKGRRMPFRKDQRSLGKLGLVNLLLLLLGYVCWSDCDGC